MTTKYSTPYTQFITCSYFFDSVKRLRQTNTTHKDTDTDTDTDAYL